MRADRRSALVGSLLRLIGHRPVAEADFAGVTDAAGSSALAEFSAQCVTGISDGGKRGQVRQLVLRRR